MNHPRLFDFALLGRSLSLAGILILAISPAGSAQDDAAQNDTAQDASATPLTLTKLSGESLSTSALSIADGKLTGPGLPTGIALDDLRKIEVAAVDSASQKPIVAIELRGGGRLEGKSVTLADDACQLAWTFGPALSIPIDAIRAIRFDPSAASPEFDKAIAAPSPDSDRIYFLVEGQPESIAGLIAELSTEGLTFEIDGQERKLPRSQLFGIVLAQAQAEDPVPPATIHLRDGGQLSAALTSLQDGTLSCTLPGDSDVAIPWSAVARIDIRSSREAFLSDLKPTAVDEAVLVTLPRPWQRDKAVTGKPLELAAGGGTTARRTYDKGIGVHARSALSFESGREYDLLAATIGIDAGTDGKGDCVFRVLGDGQSIFSRRMKGTDPPFDLRVEIRAYDEITLVVEPGAGLDLADHANWCEVRMVRGK
jgi:hypothetical protein